MMRMMLHKKNDSATERKLESKILFSIVSVLILFLLTLTLLLKEVHAEPSHISVRMNGQPILTDAPPYLKDNRVYISLRSISNALNLDLLWIQEENKVTLSLEDTFIELFTEDSIRHRALINGEENLMDTPLEIFNDRTMVPARFVAEHMGFGVDWDGFSFTLLLTHENYAVAVEFIEAGVYSDEDFLWLSRIVQVETGGSQIENKLAVANVVLNRMKHPDYPSTIYDVIFDRKWAVQFPPAFKPGFVDLVPSHESRMASKMALNGYNNVERCLWFNNRPFNRSNITFYQKIGGNYFYY
jgi:N-acetylmuramoyl-L-alanine amidase